MAKPARARCPTCGAARSERFRPFCSKRCAEIDLGRWFSGGYAIPTEEEPDDAGPILGQDDEDDGF